MKSLIKKNTEEASLINMINTNDYENEMWFIGATQSVPFNAIH